MKSAGSIELSRAIISRRFRCVMKVFVTEVILVSVTLI
jgi:hypothetical protein